MDDENDSFETIRTDVPPSNEPSIPQSNVHLSNELVLTNVPQSNEPFQTIPANVPLLNEPSIPQSMHTCIRVETEGRNAYKAASSTWVASIIKQNLGKDPNYKPSRMIDDMEIHHNIDVTYNLAWRGKKKPTLRCEAAFSTHTNYLRATLQKNPGIINVVPKVFLFAFHTFCAFHISNNIKTTLKSTRIAFRMAAEALTSIDFDKHMNAIRNNDPVGLQYKLGIPKETWSNLYNPMSRYGVAYTNHVESWNNVILKVRDLPIHVFIEELHKICSEMSYTYREEAEKSQARLTPWVANHCESKKFVADSLTWRVRTSCHHFQVNIEDGTCSCRWWQTRGIPCEHGVHALGLANVDSTTRVSEYYINSTYKAVYEPIWIPIRGAMENFKN
ncbi:hypothetical protein GIB67_016811 [Kingdonia uniflora]|uniref:SWIM-type domain-containing protein n=1 Tax=Kingdonia uniflora TaxID=39325 RepID=A0A7J7LS29_9MAGN|nr:hypothetical protein GIB67_016811 [Kingdonia uniflora]